MFWDLFKRRTRSIHKEKTVHVNVKEELAKNEPVYLIRFFRNERPDNRGRYHKDILIRTDL